MARLLDRVLLNLRRGTAKADTWVAALAFVAAGWTASDGDWVWAGVAVVVGLVFLIAAGSYCWRRGYFTAKREAG